MNAILTSPFFGMMLCVGSFLLGQLIQKKTGWTLANPLVIAVIVCIAVLVGLDIPYDDYAMGADVIGWMVGPITGLLALGIYNQRQTLKAYFVPVVAGCVAGSMTSVVSVILLCKLFGIDDTITATLLPKSCTSAIAISIAESHGGYPAIAVCCVMITGMVGAVFAPAFAKWFRITDPVAQGLAVGASSHAIGTTRAREMGELQGAMSSIAIGVCGLITVLLSLVIRI